MTATVVVDTSAVVAMLEGESDAARLLAALSRFARRELSAANLVEAGAVLSVRDLDPETAIENLERFLRDLDINIATLDAAQARVAMSARLRFGKGHGHPAKLNLGDTYAYALAKVRNAPLLFIGKDFGRTDITPALA